MSDEVVVPIRNARSIANLAGGAVLLLGFTAGCAASVAGVDDQPVAVRVVSGLLGLLCLLGGVGCVVALVVSVQRREIVVGPTGVGWRTARGVAWTLGWPELRSVAVHTGWTQGRGRRHARVSLVLHGTDPGLFSRHPELRRVRDTRADGSTVRIPLTDRTELVEPLARGLSAFGGPRFAGVLDDGRVGNLSYGRPGDR